MPQTSPADVPQALNPYALAVALFVHAMLLIAALHWHPPQLVSAPTEPHRKEASLPPPKPKPELLPRLPPDDADLRPTPRTGPALPTAKASGPQLTPSARPQLARESMLPIVKHADSKSAQAGGGGDATDDAGTGTGEAVPSRGGSLEDCTDTSGRPMVADVYRLPAGTATVDAMQRRTPFKTLCLAQLDITPRPFRQGFPGMDGVVEGFGLDIRFTVNVPEADTWDVKLLSSGGATLSIDGVEVIDNDGLHPARPKMATVTLPQGPHSFRVRYVQGPSENIALMLGVRRPADADYHYLPSHLLGRPRN